MNILLKRTIILIFLSGNLFAQNSWNEHKDIIYARVDGRELTLDLYIPENVRFPYLLVWVHGGAWRSGSKNDVPMEFVKNGYATASVDYRLSEEAKFPAAVHDIKAAIRFLRAKAEDYGYWAETITVAGSSAGGHLAALVGVSNSQSEADGNPGDYNDYSSDVQAIINYFGPANLNTILMQSTPHGLSVRIPALQLFLGGQPETIPDLARLASPVHHVDEKDPPLLIFHGEQDPQVPVNQSLELDLKYKKSGLNSELHIIPGAAHGGDVFFNEKYLTIALNFLEKVKRLHFGPYSYRHKDVPKGTVTQHSWQSRIFEGTTRDYYIYVPAQYSPEKPAALMVFQDGHTYVNEEGDQRVPIVFDNLIHYKQMPVTIGLFINPGHKGQQPPESPWRNDNRVNEYDTLSNHYVTFLTEEIIPEIEKKYTISTNPKMKAIGGLSSGAICAFTAAWQRPDYFHKVLSQIGSYTNIKGGHNYPFIIRKQDKKDIKIFMQGGSRDLDNPFGNFWISNLQMEAALKFKDYEFKFVKDDGEHSGYRGGLILPEALIWLWSDVMN